MYRQYLQIRSHNKKSNGTTGLYTTVNIPAQIPILEMSGTIVSGQDIPNNQEQEYLQIGPNLYLGPSGGVDDHVNHHCQPNCRLSIVGNRVILYSIYVISAHNELTYDFATTSTNITTTSCLCNSYQCRKTIGGIQHLSDHIKEDYESKNMFPLYMTNPEMFRI